MKVDVTDAAFKRIAKIAAKEGKSALRVSVEGGGCSGCSYKFDLVDTRNDDDVAIETDGATDLIDADAKARDDQIKAIEDARDAGAPVPATPNSAPSPPGTTPGTTPTTNSNCDPRAPIGSACGNGCGAMAKQAAAFAACFVDKPSEIDPYRGQCGKSCDPEEPEVDAPATASCFESLDVAAPNRVQSRECWAVRCGTADESADGCCGPEQKTITGSPAFPDLCANAHCEGGEVPTSAHGRCECTSAYDLPGDVRVPFGPDPRR
jgi:hypothetical protein